MRVIDSVTGQREMMGGETQTDHLGRYYFILNEGTHYLQLEQTQQDGTTQIVKRVGPFVIKKNNTDLHPSIEV